MDAMVFADYVNYAINVLKAMGVTIPE